MWKSIVSINAVSFYLEPLFGCLEAGSVLKPAGRVISDIMIISYREVLILATWKACVGYKKKKKKGWRGKCDSETRGSRSLLLRGTCCDVASDVEWKVKLIVSLAVERRLPLSVSIPIPPLIGLLMVPLRWGDKLLWLEGLLHSASRN